MSLNPEDLLKQIESLGSLEDSNFLPTPKKIKINENLGQVLDTSSGKTRIRPAKLNLFNVILSTEPSLESLSPLEIRCLNCNSVLSYPGWMAKIEYDKNVFYYFLCFGNGSPSLDTCNDKK